MKESDFNTNRLGETRDYEMQDPGSPGSDSSHTMSNSSPRSRSISLTPRKEVEYESNLPLYGLIMEDLCLGNGKQLATDLSPQAPHDESLEVKLNPMDLHSARLNLVDRFLITSPVSPLIDGWSRSKILSTSTRAERNGKRSSDLLSVMKEHSDRAIRLGFARSTNLVGVTYEGWLQLMERGEEDAGCEFEWSVVFLPATFVHSGRSPRYKDIKPHENTTVEYEKHPLRLVLDSVGGSIIESVRSAMEGTSSSAFGPASFDQIHNMNLETKSESGISEQDNEGDVQGHCDCPTIAESIGNGYLAPIDPKNWYTAKSNIMTRSWDVQLSETETTSLLSALGLEGMSEYLIHTDNPKGIENQKDKWVPVIQVNETVDFSHFMEPVKMFLRDQIDG